MATEERNKVNKVKRGDIRKALQEVQKAQAELAAEVKRTVVKRRRLVVSFGRQSNGRRTARVRSG